MAACSAISSISLHQISMSARRARTSAMEASAPTSPENTAVSVTTASWLPWTWGPALVRGHHMLLLPRSHREPDVLLLILSPLPPFFSFFLFVSLSYHRWQIQAETLYLHIYFTVRKLVHTTVYSSNQVSIIPYLQAQARCVMNLCLSVGFTNIEPMKSINKLPSKPNDVMMTSSDDVQD